MMLTRKRTSLGVARTSLIALALLAGCSILSPQPDLSRFYVLTSPSGGAVAPHPGTSGVLLGLGPIRFPDYLARSQLVTRIGENQVEFSDEERWAEPLERNFVRVLGENLARLLDTEKIITLPAYLPVTVQYEIPIEVLRFEADEKGLITLAARWAIRDPVAAKLLYTTESNVTETAARPGTEAVVAALSRAVGRLGEEIAAEIGRLAGRS